MSNMQTILTKQSTYFTGRCAGAQTNRQHRASRRQVIVGAASSIQMQRRKEICVRPRFVGHLSNRATYRQTQLSYGLLLDNTGNALQDFRATLTKRLVVVCGDMTKQELLAYCAGFVDGDGSIYAIVAKQKNGIGTYVRPCISANGYDARPLQRIAGLLGGEVKPQPKGFSVLFYYGGAKKAVERLLPYLMAKKRQAKLLISLCENIASTKELALSQKGKPRSEGRIPADVLNVRHELVSEISRLNNLCPCDSIETPIVGEKLACAYLAGLLDAEGYFQIANNGKRDIVKVNFQTTDGAIARWCHSKFGGFFYELNRPTRAGKKVYLWRVENLQALSVLKAIRGYLTAKRENADLLILFQNNVSLWLKKLRGVNQFNLPDRIRMKRIVWKERLERLATRYKLAGAETKLEHPLSEGSDSPSSR